ncbi:UbiH/UbiF/VisC/COQ6 family ubiquinone biosynthesis hydroxylase [Kushneria aurantia]|uniref:UbiH/UbiF/VisC/COQ6 family ubiquinone biosynthesis hydroxylase n=1 Tax=Kushneria aurantia TaxID=504092 RepID=A0ABV6G1G6_9GAMM|nr:UbiH/UbiF/VisC/COQ6 family ubiquinone biosynthesis hydroxylase [Kushneria aurantia]
MTFDMAIVGAGPVGAALALALGERGFDVALLDAGSMAPGWQAERIDARVSAITPASQRLLERLGVWSGVLDRRLSPYTRMRVWDGEGSGEIAFDAAEIDAPALGHIVENSALRDALLGRLEACDGVTLLAPARVTACTPAAGGRCLELADGRLLHAALVVGADGARSRLRELTGLGCHEYDTGQSAIVTTVHHRHDHQGCARQRFMRSGPLAFLPLAVAGRRQVSSIVWSLDNARAETLSMLDDEAFSRELARDFELPADDIEGIEARHVFPLTQRHAQRYADEGVVLVGDAAHSLHPLAGQGVNLGFHDIAVLTEELERAAQRGAALGDLRVLSRYSRRRRGDNALMLTLMDAFRLGFGTTAPLVQVVRNAGLSITGRSALARRFLMQQAMGDRGELPALMRPFEPV